MKAQRVLKAAAALLVLGYCSLLVYQGGIAFTFQDTNARVQVPGLSIETVTKTTIDDSGVLENITIDDIFISVKTSKWYQYSRLPLIVKTWYQLARQQTWFFTDTDNLVQNITDGHMVNTNCSSSHVRKGLCCKMSVEYDYYLQSAKKWFCHFDDDNYVNIPKLVNVLQKYNHLHDWYLGKNSVRYPLRVKVRSMSTDTMMEYKFMFATGGAGFCISSSLALKMLPVASGGRFISICESIRLPDDVTMGFIIGVILQEKLTVIPEFHSHLEQLKLLPSEKFKEQISFSYGRYSRHAANVINLSGMDYRTDPTRFLSLHCLLFPHKSCPRFLTKMTG